MAPDSALARSPRRGAPRVAALAVLVMVAGVGAAAAAGIANGTAAGTAAGTAKRLAQAPQAPQGGGGAPAAEPMGGKDAAARAEDRAFAVFSQYLKEIIPQVAEALGEAPFTAVENMGARTVRLTASETWVAGSVRYRKSNAMMLYNLWRLANAWHAVKVVIVDQDGVDEVIIQDTARGLHIRVRQ